MVHPTIQPVVAIVVAAGSGSRLGAALPKALVELDGVPLVRRAVDALIAGGVTDVVVTVPADHREQFQTALLGAASPVRLVTGGASRQDSVRLGLAAVEATDDSVVLVHDAARALVPPEVVACVADAIHSGAACAVPAIPVVDSVRQLVDGGSVVVDRAQLRAVQTPQGARLGLLRAAHTALLDRGVEVTDDAAACELAGAPVTLVAGHRDALKITEPIDLILAEAILRERKHT